MKRGTTPTHTFTLPFSVGTIKTVRIIYTQGGKIVFIKTGDDVTLAGKTVQTKLTQEDTLAFDCTKHVDVQVRVLTTDGEALASRIERVSVGKCLENEVIV